MRKKGKSVPKHETAEESFARILILEAGTFARDALRTGYAVQWKPDNTPVTTIDTGVSNLLLERIHTVYPNDRIFGEEGSKEGGGCSWIIDPVDGTQALGLVPTSTICLARTDSQGQPLFSFIYNIATGDLFEARRQDAALLNDQRLQVSKKDQLKGSYVFLGSRMPKTVASNGVIYDRLESQGTKVLNVRSLAFSGELILRP
jgi:myo-inositol-1(or 4)-monophosphatase